MSALRGVFLGIVDVLSPDATTIRNRTRITADALLTVGLTVLALVMVVGYQALGRWGPRFFGDSE